MRIKAAIALAVSLSIAMIVALGVATLHFEQRLDASSQIRQRAQSSSREVGEILVLAHEYAIYSEERVAQQWTVHQAVLRQALTVDGQTPPPALQSALNELTSLEGSFEQLKQSVHTSDKDVQARRRQLLLDQVLNKTRALSDEIQNWLDQSSQEHLLAERKFRVVVLAVPVLMLLVLMVLAWMLSRKVLQPLAHLQSAVAAVAQGDLSRHTASLARDELGDLSRAFDTLAIDLVTSLRREIQEKQLSQGLLESTQLDLLGLIDATPGMSMLIDLEGRLLTANRHAAQRFGLERAEFIGRNIYSFLPQDIAASRKASADLAVSSLRTIEREDQREGNWIHSTIVPVVGPNRQVQHLAILSEDITQRYISEQKLRLAADVFTHAREGIMITDAHGKLLDVNEAITRITGYCREDVLGLNPRFLNSGRQDKVFYTAMWRELDEKGHWSGEIWNRRKSGELFAEMLTISAVRDSHAHVRQYVALFSDITSQKEHQSQLERIAHYDALTGLPNRILMADRLQQGLVQAERRGKTLVVAYLDLDGFKAVNDRHGHMTGDQLLVCIASRMKRALREGDTLARLGGDEFVAVLVDLEDVTASVPMLNRLLAAAAQTVHLDELVLQVSASLGVTFYPQEHALDADQLLRQADQAMYQAKLAGKNRYAIFDTQHDTSIRAHNENIEAIRLALAKEELVLHFQPKVNMRSGQLVGAEALVRWQHPVRGLLKPAQFLAPIEDHPVAIELGEWVIRSTLRQIAQWQVQGLHLPVSVNIGARQLQQEDFVERLHTILQSHPNVNPGMLQFEILETSALEDVTQVTAVIAACGTMGIEFALDDFGTGYASLSYLRRLPVSVLKIDQSFVRGMLDNEDDRAILKGIVSLAKAFRREVIAEGVESVAHGSMLLALGCDCAQGHGIAVPMPAAELPAWAAHWALDAAWPGAEITAGLVADVC